MTQSATCAAGFKARREALGADRVDGAIGRTGEVGGPPAA